MDNGTETAVIDAAPEGDETPNTEGAETQPEGDVEADAKPEETADGEEGAEKEAATPEGDVADNMTISRAELNALVKVMAEQAQVQSKRLAIDEKRAQTTEKKPYVSAWERNQSLAGVSKEARQATQSQVEAALEDWAQSKGIDFGIMAELPKTLRELQTFAYSETFSREAREAAEELGLKGDEFKKADQYAREQFQKQRAIDYPAAFSEYMVKRDAKKRADEVRAQVKGKEIKKGGQKDADTGAQNRSGGEKEFVPSKAAKAAMAAGDIATYLELTRKERGQK